MNIPGRHAERRPRETHETTARRKSGPIVGNAPSDRYRGCRGVGKALMHLIDTHAPSLDAKSIVVYLDELTDEAMRMPQLRDASIMVLMSDLRRRRLLDFHTILENGRAELLISPWSFRVQLVHTLNERIGAYRLARMAESNAA